MRVILVGKNNPRERLYLESLSIHAETAEEPSHLILRYPPLFLEGFVREAFFTFVERGALQPVSTRELRGYRGRNVRSERVLARFPAQSGYVSSRQQNVFLRDAKEYLALPRERAELRRSGLFFSLQRCGKAASAYERALVNDRLDRATKSCPLDRGGAALASPFLSECTFDCFQEVYAFGRDRNTTKHMYFLAGAEIDEILKARSRRELPEMQDSEKAHWGERLRRVTSRGATGRETKGVAGILAEQNKTKCRARKEKIIAQQRKEYRSMV